MNTVPLQEQIIQLNTLDERRLNIQVIFCTPVRKTLARMLPFRKKFPQNETTNGNGLLGRPITMTKHASEQPQAPQGGRQLAWPGDDHL